MTPSTIADDGGTVTNTFVADILLSNTRNVLFLTKRHGDTIALA
jgi:hypothetical protein